MKPLNRAITIGAALALALTAGGATMAREAPTMTVAVIDFTNPRLGGAAMSALSSPTCSAMN
jgi:hypothetical protein